MGTSSPHCQLHFLFLCSWPRAGRVCRPKKTRCTANQTKRNQGKAKQRQMVRSVLRSLHSCPQIGPLANQFRLGSIFRPRSIGRNPTIRLMKGAGRGAGDPQPLSGVARGLGEQRPLCPAVLWRLRSLALSDSEGAFLPAQSAKAQELPVNY